LTIAVPLVSKAGMAGQRTERKLPLIFLAASVFVGLLSIIINPPLRGPDESVHFIRAYAIAQGEFVPTTRDAGGQRGVFLPPPLNGQFRYFNEMRESPPAPGRGYGIS
jgi:hypothetical protein